MTLGGLSSAVRSGEWWVDPIPWAGILLFVLIAGTFVAAFRFVAPEVYVMGHYGLSRTPHEHLHVVTMTTKTGSVVVLNGDRLANGFALVLTIGGSWFGLLVPLSLLLRPWLPKDKSE